MSPPIPRRVAVTELARQMGRSGDLGRRHFSLLRGVEGIRAHQRLQKDRGESYQAEVSMHRFWQGNGGALELFGRIDGVARTADGVWLEEFKTTRNVEETPAPDEAVHRLQCMVYAWMLWKEEGILPSIRLEYVHPNPGTPTRRVEWIPEAAQLETEIGTVLQAYLDHCLEQEAWREERNHLLHSLRFPFPELRPGQQELMDATEHTLRSGGQLLVQAPTGIGKTMGILLPALWAMGEGRFQTLIIATCRNTGKRIFEEAFELLIPGGACLRVLTLVARERVCRQIGSPCDCEICPLAKGFYDRLPEAMAELKQQRFWNAVTWRAVADRHQICPFAFMMYAAREADVLIGDLNYALDPSARLEFLLGTRPEEVCVLVDEAHHVPDRARSMLSASVDARLIREGLRSLPPDIRTLVNPGLQRVLRAMRRYQNEELESDGRPGPGNPPPQELAAACWQALESLDVSLAESAPGPEDARLEISRQLRSFQQSVQHRQRSHVTYREQTTLHHFCRDPAEWLSGQFKALFASVLFSGTLHPLEVFQRSVGAEAGTRSLELASPYDPDRFRIQIETGIPLVWKARGPELYDRLTARIMEEITARATKTLVYFPSYALLKEVAERMPEADMWLGPVWVQPRGLQEEAADEFLRPFREEKGPVTGLAVLGAALNEGIDLPGGALESVIVVSIGLPAVTLERELMREWFQAQGDDGFVMAYTLPGLTRVLQALGRVIRGPGDHGTALLIDPRFSHPIYRAALNACSFHPLP
ncbi:MAG: ATP-dependent DNA helicase [Kiritimatiellia bacterium]